MYLNLTMKLKDEELTCVYYYIKMTISNVSSSFDCQGVIRKRGYQTK